MAWYDYIIPQVALSKYLYHRAVPDVPGVPPPNFGVIPRVDEGASVPIVYGTVRVRSPILVWYGNILTPGQSYDAVGIPGSPFTADHYSIDTLFLIGIPFDCGGQSFHGGKAELLRVWFGDALLATGLGIAASAGTTQQFEFGPTPPATTDFSVNGVFYQGGANQDVTNGTSSTQVVGGTTYDDGVLNGASYDQALLNNGDDDTLIPGYRQQMLAFMHIGTGLSPTVPSVSFEVRSLSTGTNADLGHSLADDADPAAVLYDVLTSSWGKLAIPTSMIDLPSFQAASLYMVTEGTLASGLGYSRIIDQATDARALVEELLRHMDGLIYVEPTTGKIVLRLIRAGATPVLDINPSNMHNRDPGWYVVQAWAETLNQVVVKFTDRGADYGPGTITAQDAANISMQGGKLRSVTLSFPGCTTAPQAAYIASRELAAVSRPSVKATCVVDRTFYLIRPGDVVTLTEPELGISGMVMRVISADLGLLNDNKIRLELLRDVFGATRGSFPPP